MYQATRSPSPPMRENERGKLFQATEEGVVGSFRNRKRNAFWPHVFLAMFGAGWAVSFDFGVRIYLAEIISLLGIIFLHPSKLLGRYSNLRKIILIYMLWLGAIALSDLINQSSVFAWARNSGTPLLGGVSLIVCCAALSANPRSLLTFLLFTAAAKGLLGEPLYGDNFKDIAFSWSSFLENSNIFKVKVEPFLTPLIILIACFSKNNYLKYSSYLFTISGLIYLMADARSSGLIFLVSAVVLFKIQSGVKLRSRLFLIGFATILIVLVGHTAYVKYTLDYNPTGQSGQQLRNSDNPYNPFALFQQGRPEWTVMPQAISERPLFGWGSWAEDKDLRFSYIQAEKTSESIDPLIEMIADKIYIPTHSLVGSVWLWSGALGFVLMLWLLKIFWEMGLVLNSISSQLLPAGVLMLISLFWHYAFSPSIVVRISFPIALALLILLTDRVNQDHGNRNIKWVNRSKL